MEAAAAAAAARAKAEAGAAPAVAQEKGKRGKGAQKDKATGGNPSGTTTIAQHAQNTELPPDLDEWELSEGGLPEGANLWAARLSWRNIPKMRLTQRRPRRTSPVRVTRATPYPGHDENHKTPGSR